MANDTRDKILNAALNLFSENGYAGTNIQSIADSVGIVKSALYRHYKSKEEIWNAVLDMMSSYYEINFGSAELLTRLPKNTDELFEMTMRMVNFTVYDDKVVKMRKIILTEQFRDERIRKLATKYFINDTKAIFEKVFASMIETGIIKKADIDYLSLSYTAPITTLIHFCDREPELIPDAIARIEQFVRYFIETYGVTK